MGSPNGKTISFKKLKQKTENEIERMQKSSFFRFLWIMFKLIISSNHYFLNSIKVNIICLGLGSFCNSLSSMQQISFLCALMKQFTKEENGHFILNKVELFEPILNEIEKAILNEFGIDVLCKNEMGKYAVNDIDDNVISICFMPHCPQILYNNLLATNWGYSLSKMYIIGNSFERYLQFKKCIDWMSITKKLNIIKAINIWTNSDDNDSIMNAFAFQQIIYFPIQRILKISQPQWSKFYNQLKTEEHKKSLEETINIHKSDKN